MQNKQLIESIDKLSHEFSEVEFQYLETDTKSQIKTHKWFGNPTDDIMMCVYKGTQIHEQFHKQDFFFFNYAYKGDYGAISYAQDNRVLIHEGECYIGQPSSGYALFGQSDCDIIIIGILIQKEVFFRTFLSILSSDNRLFRFFLEPQTDTASDNYIRLQICDTSPIRSLLEIMVNEYASRKEDTQNIIKPLALAVMMEIARQYKASKTEKQPESISDRIVAYIGTHYDTVTLKELSEHFSYHPNYISTMLHQNVGKPFSEILLSNRMERASALIKGTKLSIEEIALMLGYSNSSNFYKAFRQFYGVSPRNKTDKH